MLPNYFNSFTTCQRDSRHKTTARFLIVSLTSAFLTLITASSLTAQTPQQPSCDPPILTVQPATDAYPNGISCVVSDDFTLKLGDNLVIRADQDGINLSGSGELNIESLGTSQITTTGNDSYGILVNGGGGNVNLEISGSVAVEGQESVGISVINMTPGDKNFSTKIQVHDVTTTGPNDIDADFVLSAVEAFVVGGLEIHSTGSLSTAGDLSPAVFAVKHLQAGEIDPLPFTIAVNDVETQGIESHGIQAVLQGQPVAVEGAIVPSIGITVNGDILTRGPGAHGMYIEPTGANLKIVIGDDGSVETKNTDDTWPRKVGEAEPAHAIYVDNDSDCIPASDVLIENNGRISSDVYAVGKNPPSFKNSGLLDTAGTISLISQDCDAATVAPADPNAELEVEGSFGLFENNGTVSPGGPDNIQKVKFNSNYSQSDSGMVELDIDWENETADNLEVIGTASLSGTLVLNETSLPIAPGRDGGSVEFMTVADKADGSFQLEPENYVLIDYGLEELGSVGSSVFSVNVDLDLNPDGLNENQLGVLHELHRSSTGSDQIGEVFTDVAYAEKIGAIKSGMDRFGNEIANTVVQTTLRSAVNFVDEIADCDSSQPTVSQQGPNSCLWASIGQTRQENEGNESQLGFGHDATNFTAGMQIIPLDDVLKLDLAMGTESGKTSIAEVSSSTSNIVHFGARAAAEFRGFGLSLAATVSSADHQVTRNVFDTPNGGVSAGKPTGSSTGIHGELSWTGEFPGGLWISPFAGASMVDTSIEAYGETGLDDMSLEVEAIEKSVTVVKYGLDVGMKGEFGRGFSVNPRFGIARSQYSDGMFEVTSSFAGGARSFVSKTEMPVGGYDLYFNVDFATPMEGLSASFGVEGNYTKDGGIQGNGYTAQVAYQF